MTWETGSSKSLSRCIRREGPAAWLWVIEAEHTKDPGDSPTGERTGERSCLSSRRKEIGGVEKGLGSMMIVQPGNQSWSLCYLHISPAPFLPWPLGKRKESISPRASVSPAIILGDLCLLSCYSEECMRSWM